MKRIKLLERLPGFKRLATFAVNISFGTKYEQDIVIQSTQRDCQTSHS